MLHDELVARLAEMGSAPDYPRLCSEVLGIRGASAELARRLVMQALVVEDRHETWRRVGERACRDAPISPGVYVFRDTAERALYVGKAVNLRRRLRAHFAARQWLALKPAMARVARVEWEAVGSEIEGLLREATLIREWQPIVNVQISTRGVRTRVVPRALVRDVVILAPSADADSVELIAASADGRSMLQRTHKNGDELAGAAERLWRFFQTAAGEAHPDEQSLAPLVFSWLAGRGRDTTRIDPQDASSSADLHGCLAALLSDTQLFVERLVKVNRAPGNAL